MTFISKFASFSVLFGLLIPLIPIQGFNIIQMLGFSMITISLGVILLNYESEYYSMKGASKRQ